MNNTYNYGAINEHFTNMYSLWNDSIQAIDIMIAVTKKFDGKQLNVRYTKALLEAEKDIPVMIYFDKNFYGKWQYYTRFNYGVSYRFTAPYFWEASGTIPETCIDRSKKMPRLKGSELVQFLENQKKEFIQRMEKYKDYQSKWEEKIKRYNALCDEIEKIFKDFPCELRTYFNRDRENGVHMHRPYDLNR